MDTGADFDPTHLLLAWKRGVAASNLQHIRYSAGSGARPDVCNFQVLGISRLSKGGWIKIAHHLGRAGPSAVQNITFKYRTLKKQAGADASTGAFTGQAAQGTSGIASLLSRQSLLTTAVAVTPSGIGTGWFCLCCSPPVQECWQQLE